MRKIIFVDKASSIRAFERRIELKGNGVLITDSFENTGGAMLERASNMSLRHVASGKFFMTSRFLARSGAVDTASIRHHARFHP
jgi:hypothetical protein